MKEKKSFSFLNFKKLSSKINVLFASILFTVIFSMLVFNYFYFRDTMHEVIEKECLNSTYLLEQQLIGEFAPTEDEDIIALLDELKETTDTEYTIFSGTTRQFTTITVDGERITGTEIDPAIGEIVITNGQPYIGHTEIAGVPFLVSYSPHHDSQGNIIGALFAGRPTTSVYPALIESSIYNLALGLFLVIIAIIIGTIFVKNVITKRLDKAVTLANKLSEGDFSTKVEYSSQKDEIGVLNNACARMNENLSLLKNDVSEVLDSIANNNWIVQRNSKDAYVGEWRVVTDSIDTMISTVRTSLSEVSLSADQISADSDQIAQGSQQLASASEEQSASVESLTITLNDVSQKVNENLQSSKHAAEIARNSGEVTSLTLEEMKNMQKAMIEISTASENISKIVKVIHDISFQTNILALNASVEAARAGSAGSGFAVVADEVRNLAQKSSDAAEDITHLIDHSIESVQNGVRICDKTNVSFEELARKVQEMVVVIEEIFVSSEQQTFGVNQITKEISEISSTIHHNSATSEESAASSQQLAAQANILNQVVSKFKI